MSDKQKIERLENVVGTLINWMAQTANTPISRVEVTALLRMLNEPWEPRP